jgi:hypothetical protein
MELCQYTSSFADAKLSTAGIEGKSQEAAYTLSQNVKNII